MAARSFHIDNTCNAMSSVCLLDPNLTVLGNLHNFFLAYSGVTNGDWWFSLGVSVVALMERISGSQEDSRWPVERGVGGGRK